MRRNQNSSCVWFEFELFRTYSTIKHGCCARQGGVSSNPYNSLNLGFVEDDRSLVLLNREIACHAIFGDQVDEVCYVQQVHGVQIAHVSHGDQPIQADALITTTPRVALLIQHADCQAAIMFDPVRSVIANVHAGWRGNVANIYGVVIQTLCEQYGSNPTDILVGIGPSLGPDWAEFQHWQAEFPAKFGAYQSSANHFDLWQLAHDQLLAAGIASHHIEIARICTASSPELFFSYRRDGLTGRNGTYIALI